MQIDHNILIAYGGVAKKYKKGDFIFHEGAQSSFYFQLIEGTVRVFSTNDQGKELMQGHFEAGQSFGEPPLLLNKRYPSTAEACTPCVVVRIGKEKLLNILKQYPDIMSSLLHTFAERIYQKASAAQVWVCQSPEEKIQKFLQHKVGNKNGTASLQYVPYTRQQIADYTGLRVETVIRTLLRMCKQKKINIVDHKIYV